MPTERTELDRSLADSIAELKERFPRTQDLYREVCVLMFFHHGITPTANRLYQLVRKGSMSAPTQAVQDFWERLRERSRVTVDHATLPDELKAAAGELVSTLWQSAQTMSNDMLARHQEESTASVLAAREGEAKARADHRAAMESLELVTAQCLAQEKVVEQLRQELSGAAAINTGLEARLEELRQDVVEAHEGSEQLKLSHTLALETLSERTQRAEQRFVDMEKRALLEIDRERVAGARLQKILESDRVAHSAATERLRVEHNAAQEIIGQLREQVGALQNAVSSREGELHREYEEMAALQVRFEAAVRQSAADQARAEQLQAALKRHQTEVEGRLARVESLSKNKRRHKHSTYREQQLSKAEEQGKDEDEGT